MCYQAKKTPKDKLIDEAFTEEHLFPKYKTVCVVQLLEGIMSEVTPVCL